jgi:hypothetical protein
MTHLGQYEKFSEVEGQRISISFQSIQSYLSLLNLTPEVQEMVSEDKL